ncbi:hypothetical protein PoB_000917100 [Plakobranchus ocellatus]|uniref:Uncharacterized protein n=1 Tax=Plakobranchus ocellatus TaxID=259542 RepID=A0AAV3YHK4_9GAST|nr:hypothetical protein PoB_000917100 [Plakobranchus ocellatus]
MKTVIIACLSLALCIAVVIGSGTGCIKGGGDPDPCANNKVKTYNGNTRPPTPYCCPPGKTRIRGALDVTGYKCTCYTKDEFCQDFPRFCRRG